MFRRLPFPFPSFLDLALLGLALLMTVSKRAAAPRLLADAQLLALHWKACFKQCCNDHWLTHFFPNTAAEQGLLPRFGRRHRGQEQHPQQRCLQGHRKEQPREGHFWHGTISLWTHLLFPELKREHPELEMEGPKM